MWNLFARRKRKIRRRLQRCTPGHISVRCLADALVDFDSLARASQSLDSFFFDAEKVVAEWPTVEGRVVEEWR